MIEIIIFHVQDTNVQSETFSKELLHYISHATQLSILHVPKVTKFSPACVAHEILISHIRYQHYTRQFLGVSFYACFFYADDLTLSPYISMNRITQPTEKALMLTR